MWVGESKSGWDILIHSKSNVGLSLLKVWSAINIIHLWRDFGVYRCVGTRSYDNYLGRPSYGSSYGRGYDRTESVYMEVLLFPQIKSNSISSLQNLFLKRSSSIPRSVATQEVSMGETITIHETTTGVAMVDTGTLAFHFIKKWIIMHCKLTWSDSQSW